MYVKNTCCHVEAEGKKPSSELSTIQVGYIPMTIISFIDETIYYISFLLRV
jgi:hypothetical protein